MDVERKLPPSAPVDRKYVTFALAYQRVIRLVRFAVTAWMSVNRPPAFPNSYFRAPGSLVNRKMLIVLPVGSCPALSTTGT